MNGLLEIQKDTLTSVPDLIIIFDNSGKIIFSGGSFLFNSGQVQSVLAGKRIQDIFVESSDLDFSDLESINGKETVLSLVHENLKGKNFFCKFLPGYNSCGEGDLHILSGHLITDKRHVPDLPEKIEALYDLEIEKALINSENRYKNLFYNSPIGIYRTAPDGSILMANPALIKMLGYSDFEELSRRNLEDKNNFQTGYSREEFKKRIEAEGSLTGFESKWIRNDGRILFIRENAKCIYGQNGGINFYEGTVEDITTKVEAEAALMESEEKFRTLAEQSPNIIFIYQDNHIKYINDKCTEVIGYPKEYFTDPAFNWLKLLTEQFAKKLNGKLFHTDRFCFLFTCSFFKSYRFL